MRFLILFNFIYFVVHAVLPPDQQLDDRFIHHGVGAPTGCGLVLEPALADFAWELFTLYDVDSSGSLNSFEELRNLTVNLVITQPDCPLDGL